MNLSEASEEDFQAYLDHQYEQLPKSIEYGRGSVAGEFAAAGRLRSGMALLEGCKRLEAVLMEHVATISGATPGWSGEKLTIDRARALATKHLRRCTADYMTPERASPIKRGLVRSDAAWNALAGRVEEAAGRVEQRIRQFEIGVGEKALATPGPFNVVNAGAIYGGVQQAGHSAVQHSTVMLDVSAVRAAVQELSGAIESDGNDALLRAAQPDLRTIEIQLEKPEPSIAILQESGRSLRTIIEGAVGGAIGGAATPAVVKALTLLGVAIGIA